LADSSIIIGVAGPAAAQYPFSPVIIEMSFKSKKLPRISRITRIL
jgi:hypothetical protein